MTVKFDIPPTIYLIPEKDGENIDYIADADLEVLAEIGKPKRVGVYKLVEVAELSVEVDLKKLRG